jgi:hypothetical protein
MKVVKAGFGSPQLSTISHGPSTAMVIDFTLLEAVPLPSGAISWWPAGGNAQDALTNHNNGTGYYEPSYGPGEAGQAFSLSGPNEDNAGSHFRVADSASVHVTGPLTIEAWVNPTTVEDCWFSSIIDKWDLTGPPQESYGLALAPDAPRTLL